jgi:DNA-binding NarL/FixJ family response regulator
VVDDQASFRRAAQLLLSLDPDIEVVGTSSSGPEALEFLTAQQADLVLMDVNMPGMSGLEAATHVRQRHPEVAVLLCSTQTAASLGIDPQVGPFVNKDDIDGALLREWWARLAR